jgi:hypothetical protein
VICRRVAAGYLVKNSSHYFSTIVKHGATARRGENFSLPEYQVWAKPQPGGKLAVLIVNVCDAEHCAAGGELSSLTVPLLELYHKDLYPSGPPAGGVTVRDLWAHADREEASTSIEVKDIAPHGGQMLLLTPM